MTGHQLARSCVVLVAVVVIGCGGGSSPERSTPAGGVSSPVAPGAAASATTAGETPSSDSLETMSPAEPCGPGEAWALSFSNGAACLDEVGWKIFDRTGTPSWDIDDVAACADGTTWLADSSGLVSTDGETWVSHAVATGFTTFSVIACDPEKGVWLIDYEGVHYYDGETMTTYAASELGSDLAQRATDIAVAPDGRVWVLTTNNVATWDGTGWQYWEPGNGFEETHYFEQIVVDQQGRVWVSTSSTGRLLLYDTEKWSIVAESFLAQSKALAVDTNNRLWVGTYASGVSVLDGSKWVTYDRANSDLPSDHVLAIAADISGRVWLGTEWGLVVVEGKKWTVYHMSDSDIRDNEVVGVAVAGRGPALPGPEAKDPGTLTGRVIMSDGPKSGLKVEACAEDVIWTVFGSSDATPCADQEFHELTTTEAEGKFTFAKLPPGRYAVTVLGPDGKWLMLTNETGLVATRFLVEPNETTDLGDLDITPTN